MEPTKQCLFGTTDARPRKKLQKQKSFRKPQINTACRFNSTASSLPEASTDFSLSTVWTQPRPPPVPPKKKEGASPQSERGQHEQHLFRESLGRYSRHIVPGVSHLIRAKQHLRSLSSSEATKHSTPRMGRRAKTPFCSIRKLEDFPQPPTHVLGRTSSVDRIAEQYKAVLESRPRSLCWDDSSELELSPADSDTEQPVTLRQHRSSCCPGGDESCLSHPSRTAAFPKPSPMSSDDGTLVSFQEETVYFKPVSFPTSKPEAPSFAKPEPPTVPLSRQTTAAAADADADADENVSLQICLDLLTRELSSAMAARPSRASSMGSSALQVWVMIEAYEGLRDQMAELSRGNRQAREMERMFDMWLRALYSIHDSMRGVGGKDCGAELGTEALD